jgi:molybdopterin/thiamine biosynthesis adenylyltransferase
MSGHDQSRLDVAHIVVVGCGGLGSWIAVGLARMGVRRFTLIDDDHFDRTNAPRQLMFGQNIGESKAHALAQNVVPHMTNPGELRSIALPLEQAWPSVGKLDALIVGVDNNRTRLTASSLGRRLGVPVIFAMLSRDGLRAQVFRQDPGGPCLTCVLPNLDPDAAAPCAAAAIAACFLAAAHAVEMAAAAIMRTTRSPSWRESSLDGTTERAGSPMGRSACLVCSE